MIKFSTKVWGCTREIVSSPYYSKHELVLTSGGYCSIHYHHHRANRFKVIDGKVNIVSFYGPTYSCDRLSRGQECEVPSLVPHMFIVEASGLMFEEYYPDRGGTVRDDDIVRLTEGGVENIADIRMLPDKLMRSIINV